MIKRIFIILAILLSLPITAYTSDTVGLFINGSKLNCTQQPLIINGRTLVPLRAVCEALKLGVSWNPDDETIKISDEFNLVILKIGSNTVLINEDSSTIEAPAQIYNGHTLIPIRSVAEAFGATVVWNDTDNAIEINHHALSHTDSAEIIAGLSLSDDETDLQPSEEAIPYSPDSVFNPDAFSFYCQPDPQWSFDNNGRGYCWVCSYAMLITNLTDTPVTPIEISQYNLDNGATSGSYIASHYGIASKYGLEFAPALDTDSTYFMTFETDKRGATYINAETDEDVINALTEALTLHTDGVMVRFEGYPHTLVATHTEDGTVYFNDPAGNECENVDFSGTCLANKFSLTDISFIQALVKK